MNYKRINELGLIIYRLYNNGECEYVRASDLEALLEKGVEVRSYSAQTHWFPSVFVTNNDTHSGLVINIKPFENPKPISMNQLISDLKLLKADRLAERIEKWGIEQSGVSDE